ncbi:MAG: protein NosL [Betaproteobacteria bacterium]|nr:protein NosL [Betaproteobacteria bacterium]
MRRRTFLHLVPGVALVPALSACGGQSTSGPVEVKWDRDGCTRCGMAISEKVFAAEVRDPQSKKIYKFDDFGCAVAWSEHQPWSSDPRMEFWVADSRDGRWLDARKAQFVAGKRTPMAYGFGAVAEAVPGSVSFEEAKKLVLAKGK